MKAVGVRELKSRLSHYLREVKGGETVLVTERGLVIAELGQPGRLGASGREPTDLERLAGLVTVTHSGSNEPAVYESTGLAMPAGTAERLIDAERGE